MKRGITLVELLMILGILAIIVIAVVEVSTNGSSFEQRDGQYRSTRTGAASYTNEPMFEQVDATQTVQDNVRRYVHGTPWQILALSCADSPNPDQTISCTAQLRHAKEGNIEYKQVRCDTTREFHESSESHVQGAAHVETYRHTSTGCVPNRWNE